MKDLDSLWEETLLYLGGQPTPFEIRRDSLQVGLQDPRVREIAAYGYAGRKIAEYSRGKCTCGACTWVAGVS